MNRLYARIVALAVAGAAVLIVPMAAATPAQAVAGCQPWRQADIFHAMDINGVARPGITFRIMTDEVHSQVKITRDRNFTNVKDLHTYVYEQDPGGLRWVIDPLIEPQQAGTTICSKWNRAGTALFVRTSFRWPGDNGYLYTACTLYPSSQPAYPCYW